MSSEQSQRTDQRAADLESAIDAKIRAAIANLHTALPGIVRSFDAAKQTVRVTPAIKRVWIDEGPLALPDIVDVPVHFPGGGGFTLTFPVAAGDNCILVFSERAIDKWFHAGGVQEPSEVVFHDLSDAFALVGVRPKPNAIANVSTDAVELRSDDGATAVRLEKSMVILGSVNGAQPPAMGDIQNAINAAIKDHVHVCTGGTVSPSASLAVPGVIQDVRAKKVKVS